MTENSISSSSRQNNSKNQKCSKGSIQQKSNGTHYVAWYHDRKQYKIYYHNGKRIESREDGNNLLAEMRHDAENGAFNIASYIKNMPRMTPSQENDDQFKAEKIIKIGKKGTAAAERKLKFLYNAFECYFCSGKNNLEMHHVVPNKNDRHVHWQSGDKHVGSAIEKCVPLCRACHKKLHNICRAGLMPHGTLYAYEIYNCRCIECSRARSDYNAYISNLKEFRRK